MRLNLLEVLAESEGATAAPADTAAAATADNDGGDGFLADLALAALPLHCKAKGTPHTPNTLMKLCILGG